MKCPVCQTEVSEGMAVCPTCGTILKVEAEPKTLESIKKIKEKEILTEEEKEAAILFGQEKKILERIRPTIFWWAIVFLIILIGLGGVSYFLSKKPFKIIPGKTYLSYLPSYLPSEISFLVTVNLDNINQLQDLKSLLDKTTFLKNFSSTPSNHVNQLLEEFNLDFKTNIRPLINQKIYFFQIDTLPPKQFLLLSVKETESIKTLIENLKSKLPPKKMNLTTTDYQNNLIYNINKEFIKIPPSPGGTFQPFLSFTFLDRYLVISDKSENISFLIDTLSIKKTLESVPEYKNLLSHIDEQAILSIYSKNLDRSSAPIVLNFFSFANKFLKISIFKYLPTIKEFIGSDENLFSMSLWPILPGKPSYYFGGSNFQATVNLQKIIHPYLENKIRDWQSRLAENNLDLNTDILAWLNKEYALGFYDYKLKEPAVVFVANIKGNQDKAYTAINKIKTTIENKLIQNYPKKELKFKEIEITGEKVNVLELPSDIWYGLDVYYILLPDYLVVTTSEELMKLVLTTILGQNKDILSQNKYLNNLKNQLPSGSFLAYWHQSGAFSFYKKSLNELAQINSQWIKRNQPIIDLITSLGQQLEILFSAGGISSRIQGNGLLIEIIISKRVKL